MRTRRSRSLAFAQSNQMILLTANRSMKGENSLEQVMREEITPTSLPVE
ncbi:hypothetical protein FDUTEX481_02036 [Tolypothrix sp. PCC 7601]|nr:hypothetical protein FDUTEX481_02036 [Tolypothrix sp. PCC 7601]